MAKPFSAPPQISTGFSQVRRGQWKKQSTICETVCLNPASPTLSKTVSVQTHSVRLFSAQARDLALLASAGFDAVNHR